MKVYNEVETVSPSNDFSCKISFLNYLLYNNITPYIWVGNSNFKAIKMFSEMFLKYIVPWFTVAFLWVAL